MKSTVSATVIDWFVVVQNCMVVLVAVCISKIYQERVRGQAVCHALTSNYYRIELYVRPKLIHLLYKELLHFELAST